MEKEIVYSSCGEVFGVDDLADYEVGDHYFSGTKEEVKPSELVGKWIADTIVESMEESLYEVVGDLAEDALHLSESKQQGLLDIIKYYMDENVSISCYKVVDIEEHIVEEEENVNYL